MHRCVRFALPIAALAITLVALPAAASKTSPNTIGPVTVTTAQRIVGTPIIGSPTNYTPCPSGIFPPPYAAYGYVLPPDDAYYTLLTPQCPGFPNAACYCLTVSAAHVQLYFESDCSVPVTVSVVGGAETQPGCFGPNPFDIYCTPVTYVLDNGGVRGTCIDFVLPMDVSCCVPRPVFLAMTFNAGTCPPQRPAFCSPAQCANCKQYNIYPGAPPGGDDLCATLSPFNLYGVIMYADSYCNGGVPVAPDSWGHLKTIYR